MFQRLKGLKFPDDYVIRFFFKNSLHNVKGTVVEFGCGSGNNLMLFLSYGWSVTGFDMDQEQIRNAEENARLVGGEQGRFSFFCRDVSKVERLFEGSVKFDCVLLPNVLCYLKRQHATSLLRLCGEILNVGGHIFVRTRMLNDYRFARGQEVEKNGFLLKTPETCEEGLLNVFYEEHELVGMIEDNVGIKAKDLQVLRVYFENLQNGRLITNSDIIVWGRLGG